MLISIDYFHQHLVSDNADRESLIAYTTNPAKIGELHCTLYRLLEVGAIQVEDENTLYGSFQLDNNTYWGYYEIRDWLENWKKANEIIDDATFQLIIMGNDDTIFEKIFKSYDEAKDFLIKLSSEQVTYTMFDSKMEHY